MPAGTSKFSFVANPWLAGHVCLYAAAYSVGLARDQVRQGFNRQRLQGALKGMSTEQLKEIFSRFDTSKDGSLDASELKLALRVALGADLSMAECNKLIQALDEDGTDSLDFNEFKEIIEDRSRKEK